jgi:internalin A
VRDLLPSSFFTVKEHLERLEQLEVNYLPFADYEWLCREHGINTTGAQELLIGFLHDLGTVLCFRNDPRLRDTNILSPRWVTGGVYRLLNSNQAAQEKGLLTWRKIDTILESDDYPPEKRPFIIEMMKKFELCYESDDVFLVPDLLTKEEPDTGSWEESLRYAVRYDVLPYSIIGRLVVRMHRLISKGTVWRTGVVLTMDNNRALVKADREEALLTIRISGPARGRRGLLTAIRAELRAIERTIPGLTGEEQVPVPGHPNVWVPYSHLLNLESVGKEMVIPQGLVDEFRISKLLDGIEDKTDRARTRQREIERSTSQESVPTAETGGATEAGGADGMAWTPRNSLLLGSFLLVTIVVVIAAYIAANKFIGQAAGAAAAAVALLAAVVIALVVLRTAGRVSEQTMSDGIKEATSRIGNGQDGNTK